MKSRIPRKIKYAALAASMLILMLALSGCRTRITNNSEVTPTISDENGYMQEMYDSRRDELSLSVAEKPLFGGFGSGEEEEDLDYESDEFDYDSSEDDWDTEEDMDDTDDDDTASSGTSTTTTPSSRPSNVNVGRRRPSTTTTTGIKVTLNANGGKCSSSSITVRKGSTYGSLPSATRTGYKFTGWYTAKTGGKQVTSKTKVTNGKAHTLYAGWEERKKEVFKVSFDGNSEGDSVELSSSSMEVEEDGSYESLPTAKRPGYTFEGWYTDPSGGSQVKKGDKIVSNKAHTLYAHWKYDPHAWWENEFKKEVNDPELNAACLVDAGNKYEEGFVKECKGSIVTEEETPAYVVKFASGLTEEASVEMLDSLAEAYPDKTLILMSDDAVSGSDDQKLLYKLLLVNTLHGKTIDTAKAASDLGIEASYYTR